jgi:sulfocyanin
MSGVVATHVTSGTTGTAGAASTTSPAPAASAAAGTAARGPVKVNRFMSYDADAKKVTLEVIAAFNSQQGGFNFNGGSNGSQTITVPAGWSVAMHVKNVDAIPHSAIIILDQRPLPNAPDSPAIPRAYTSHVNDGLQPQNGSDDLSFRASKPGNYLIYCGVPGHGPSGMYIKFVVSESATTPSYSM